LVSSGQVAWFEINGKLNRFDFGLQWNALTEAGVVVVSNEVRIEILAELTKAQSASKAA
jgi:polyisoprenoid-binding protein YceI